MTNFLQRYRFFLLLLVFSCEVACAHPGARHYEQFPKTAAVPYQEAILDFYSTKDPYGEFSNFALFPVFVDDEWWATSEHYYQAHKYEKKELMAWVKEAPTPYEAALRGRDKNIEKRADWEQRKDEFMEKAVVDKFSRYPDLQNLLLSTGTARIYEHTKNDCYWGDCGDRTGKNKLGLLLEKIRTSLRAPAP
ncbi:NADAR family protein [Bdellovibrio svalbardensis]|uniref:NADAR family protein n=1 Tax=Bdellovibrio svalbardensis TaxID=2972972 RepID=A0ABT6DEB8_9BACT|nr:NADAR family protein [Bdellovibrio svalbardensis]MDG0815157.1 NADAR family protein [Bdellovibrio svalbardensis]